jgi:hypothetical protein
LDRYSVPHKDFIVGDGVVTDAEAGNYSFFNVKIGNYTIAIEHPGFSKFTTTEVTVDVTARQRVDAKLQVGRVTESVTVTAAAAVLDTDTSDHSQVIGTPQIMELLLNGRDYANLALLATFMSLPRRLPSGPPLRRRYGQQLLRIQQPGLFKPSGAAFS